ncbi:MAG: hypothetical protein Q9213_000257 [Squamulea squamosa]
MAYSPARTDSSSELYAASEPTEEQEPSRSVEHELLHDSPVASLQTMPSTSPQDVPIRRFASDGLSLNGDQRQAREEPSAGQANAYPKRKREEDDETSYPVPVQSGDSEPHLRSEYITRDGHSILQDDVMPLSGPKRFRINSVPPAKAISAGSHKQPVTLPAELWHHIFRFVPPVFLGRLLRVNKAFHSYLTPEITQSKQMDASFHGCVRPLDAESIWAASRKRFAPGLPKPLRDLNELDMWRLLRGRACQLCGQCKDPVAMAGDVSPWESGPGDRTVRIIWPFGIRSCGTCLEKSTEKDIDLLLSSDFPSFLRLALPFALVTRSLNYVPNALLHDIPLTLEPVRRYYKPHIQQIRQQLDNVRELGTAPTDEWSKGLNDMGGERRLDAVRWEQWEAKGGLRKVNTRPQSKIAAPLTTTASAPDLPPKPPNIADIGALTSQQLPIDSRYNGQPSGGFTLPVEPYQYPYSTTGSYQPPWTNPGLFQELPAHHPPPSMSLPRPERNMKSANEAKAARRAEIERRCSLLDPPLPANILKHMESFQAAIQISRFLTDFEWDALKPRLLTQRASAEKREHELVQQNELLQSEHRERHHQETQSKETRDTVDRHWDSAQAPIRDRLGALADAVIDERWYGGRAVTKENSPKFAADVLLCVRRRFYEGLATTSAAVPFPGQSIQFSSTSRSPTPKLILENMKWVFDTKIKPFTEHFQRELFLCNGCDDNFKFYGFEGVIQHYAAKHTTSLSQGSIVVYWRAEWPEEPPFNPEPSFSKSAYYKIPSPASAGPTSYSQIDQQLLTSDDRHGVAAEPEPQHVAGGYSAVQDTTVYHSNQTIPYHDNSYQYSYNTSYNMPSSMAPPDGVQNGFVQTQPINLQHEWPGNDASKVSVHAGGGHQYGLQYTGYNYAGAFNTQEAAPVTSYGSQAPFRAAAPHPPHFDPSRNNVAQLTESYQQQMDEMAKQARDVWFSTQGIKDLPASVRIYVVIQHMASRCSAKFSTVPSLAMFLDGLDNNAQMRPVRSLNGLACKICVTQHNASYDTNPQSQPPAGDRKLFTLPHLLNHFRNAHLEGSEAFANPGSGPAGPRHDWTRDMVELPEGRLISNLVYSPRMDNNKLDLIAWAFPHVFPSPLPSLGTLRSSGVLRSIGAAPEIRNGASVKLDYPSSLTDHNTLIPTTKLRIDDSVYDRPPSTFRPASELSRPSEPPGEDEYDPHKPAYQGKPYIAGVIQGRNDVLGIAQGEPVERTGWQNEYFDRSMSQTTDLSKLIYNATQMQPSHEEERQPRYQDSQLSHIKPETVSLQYHIPQRSIMDESINRHEADGDKRLANDNEFMNEQYSDSQAYKQREATTHQVPARSPSLSAGLRSAEQFLQHFGQTSDTRNTYEPSDFGQHQRPDPLEQWSRKTEMRLAESERGHQSGPTLQMSYRADPVRQDVSPRPQMHRSSPTRQADRNTSPSLYRTSTTYEHANHQRAASNGIVHIDDPEINRPGTRTHVEHPKSRGVMVQDRHSRNGYGTQRSQSSVGEFRNTQDSQFQDHTRYTVPVASEAVYYRSRSPAEDSQAHTVYHLRSPVPRKQVQRISYGYQNQDRFDVLEEPSYAHDPQTRFQQRIQYVPVHVADQRTADPDRYFVAQPRDQGARADYVRLNEGYDQGTLYERDGQLYRAEPRTYRTPVIRGAADMAPGYSY